VSSVNPFIGSARTETGSRFNPPGPMIKPMTTKTMGIVIDQPPNLPASAA
jgi:hypothetical protein